MRLIGKERLDRLPDRAEEGKKWIKSWVAEILTAHWKRPADVRDQFPNVRQQEEGLFVFPVGNCQCSIHLLIAFPQGIALIKDLKVEDDRY